MGTITINIPEGVEPYAEDLEYFVSTMARKLHTNRHKGFSHNNDLKYLMSGLDVEREELLHALKNEGQFEVAVEAADVANMAFLVALTALHLDRNQFDSERSAF